MPSITGGLPCPTPRRSRRDPPTSPPFLHSPTRRAGLDSAHSGRLTSPRRLRRFNAGLRSHRHHRRARRRYGTTHERAAWTENPACPGLRLARTPVHSPVHSRSVQAQSWIFLLAAALFVRVAFATPALPPHPRTHATFDVEPSQYCDVCSVRLPSASTASVGLGRPAGALRRLRLRCPAGRPQTGTAGVAKRRRFYRPARRGSYSPGRPNRTAWFVEKPAARDGGRARSVALRERCPPSAVLRNAPVGGSAVSPSARKVPRLGRSPRRGCPLFRLRPNRWSSLTFHLEPRRRQRA